MGGHIGAGGLQASDRVPPLPAAFGPCPQRSAPHAAFGAVAAFGAAARGLPWDSVGFSGIQWDSVGVGGVPGAGQRCSARCRAVAKVVTSWSVVLNEVIQRAVADSGCHSKA
ncbi:hypothetical protein GCM10007977_107700 [Dactylosporangium sucinum]|uniref:Uncharacterized protein n=1 Tax=Dactylosporangium sucinum TaxID=1424081 RepID=A0A917X869_9ACTN|nr:hypothetical protein GCM10007977_107700 [Dactylosporangium sucinum]